MAEMNTPGVVFRVLLVAVVSSVLSCVLTLWVVAPSPPSSGADTAQILQRLDDLQRAAEAARHADQPVVAPVLGRQPILEGDPTGDQLQEILDRMGRLERVLTSSSTAGGWEPTSIERNTPINWSQLEFLGRLHEMDRKAAQQSTILLTPAEVVRKFGLPTEVGGSQQGGLYFLYQRRAPDGSKDGAATFNFYDGYLAFSDNSFGR